DKAMAKAPDERFQTAEQMEAAIERIAMLIGDTPDHAYETKPLPAVGPAGARRASSGMFLAVIVALAGALMVGYALKKMRNDTVTGARRAQPAPGKAPEPPPPAIEAPPPSTPSAEAPAAPAPPDSASATPAAEAAPAAEEPKPSEPAKPRVADLAAGTRLRERGGPELVVVAAPARNGGAHPRPVPPRRDQGTPQGCAAFGG